MIIYNKYDHYYIDCDGKLHIRINLIKGKIVDKQIHGFCLCRYQPCPDCGKSKMTAVFVDDDRGNTKTNFIEYCYFCNHVQHKKK